MRFKDIDGNSLALEDIVALVDPKYDYEIFVGSDSQVHRGKKCVIYATCIVLYKKGKGGRIFVSKQSKSFANSLRDRLMKEVWFSLETSFELSQILPKNVEIVVHIDVNGSTRFKSGNYHQELVALVTGQGFKCKIKPQSWAAKTVADHYTRTMQL